MDVILLDARAISLEAIIQAQFQHLREAVASNSAQVQVLTGTVENLSEGVRVQEVRRLRNALNCWRTNNRTMVESAEEFKCSDINYYKTLTHQQGKS